MATDRNFVTDKKIAELSQVFGVKDMKTIAIKYFGESKESVDNLDTRWKDDPYGFNRGVLTLWRNKNYPKNQVQHLADILYAAAEKDGIIDPHKVEPILNVSLKTEEIVTETEFETIAKEMKTRVERRMKIEPFPWLRHYYVDIDNLYAKLTLKKVKNIIFGENIEDIECKQMFVISSDDKGMKDTLERKKILLKGDAGMGKTVQGKRMACDDVFRVDPIEIVFFVALKFVQNGDAIENVIIQQNPQLGEMEVSERKLQALLERFGHRCLLILDGLDEHDLRTNEDIIKIIKDKKLKNCGLVVSSRPHSIKEIENNFSTVIRLDGFSEQEARNFLSKMFKESEESEEIIGKIMDFKPSGPREHFPIYKSPILLSVISALIKGKKIDLSDSSTWRGDLYLQIVQCLYKKYTIRKGIEFYMTDLVKVMKNVGQLAFLTSDTPMLQRSEVLRIVGESAFEYGLFAGHEDFRLFADPTADIYISFVHTSVEEFFWSFGFLQALDDGKSVDDILGCHNENPTFMSNPLVLSFCLWLLETNFVQFPDIIYGKLTVYAAQCINSDNVCVDETGKYSISDEFMNDDSLKLKFFQNVFEKYCNRLIFKKLVASLPDL